MYLDPKISVLGFIVMFIIYYVVDSKKDAKFEKSIEKDKKKQMENYFEVRYFKKLYLFYIALSVPLSYIIVTNFTYRSNTYSVLGGMALIIGLFVLNFIYKSLILIVYDNGQITYYFAGVEKISGNINQVDREHTFVNLYSKVSANVWYNTCIGFSEKDKFFSIPKIW